MKVIARFQSLLKPGFVIPFAFFVALMVLGLSLYRDYGSFWDEGNERYSGIVNLNAIVHVLAPAISQRIQEKKGVTIQSLSGYQDRYYGEVLQLPMAGWEVLKGLGQDKQHMWQTRHLMLFLFVYLATVFLFLLLRKALGHWGYGLVGACFFWLSPRFFAESFYNVKDVGFLAAFIIGLYFLFIFIERPNLRRSVLVGGFSAFAAAVRILGGVFTLFAFGFSLSRVIRREISVKSFILTMAAMGVSFSLFVVLFYPASWSNPFKFFPGGPFSNVSLPLEWFSTVPRQDH